MLNMFKVFFVAPKFDDKRKNRLARYLHTILNVSALVFIVLSLTGEYAFIVNVFFGILALITLSLQFVVHAGNVNFAAVAFALVSWTSMTYIAWIGDGMRDNAITAYLILILLTSLFGNSRLSLSLLILSLVSVWVLFYAQITGKIIPIPDSLLGNALSATGIFIIFSSVLYFTISDLESTLTQTFKNEAELLERNEELVHLQEELQENSKTLKETSEEARFQAHRLETMAKIVYRITQTQKTENLLFEISSLTSQSFGFYHVGIFLTSTDQKYIQLKAASSKRGQQLIDEGYQVEIGYMNTVGQVAKDNKPRMSLGADENATPFDQPLLSETRSEMAFPLLYNQEFLGVLDIQCKKETAFDMRELEVFTTLSNQLAIAIENARQFERAQTALEEMEDISQRYIRQEWTRMQKKKSELGYRYLHGNVEKLASDESLETKEEQGSLINIPVGIRDEIIGILQVRLAEDSPAWQAEDEELVEIVANRVALALENARLLEDTAQQAGKESTLSDFAATISNISQTDKLMSVAVSELQKILGASEVSFELTDI